MFTRFACSIAALTLAAGPRIVAAQGSTFPPCPAGEENSCVSFGVDFQNGGTFFQNINGLANFTFISQFQSCQPDTAINFLVNQTNGDGSEYECTNTNLTPDNTNMLSKCPLTKGQLISGPWSLLTLSNNGNCNPVAFERDINLIVAPQSTVTITPTVTLSILSTPTSLVPTSVTSTTTSTGSALSTVTLPGTVLTQTTTVQTTSTTTTTLAFITFVITSTILNVQPQVQMAVATCSQLRRQATPDPTATFIPTLALQRAEEWGISIPPGNARRVPVDAHERKMERRRKFAEEKRMNRKRRLNRATVTTTITDPVSFVTSTVTSVAPTTFTITTTITSIVTSVTNPISTTYFGLSAIPTTVTLAPAVVTVTDNEFIEWLTVTVTQGQFPFLALAQTPPAAALACKKSGGVMQAPPAPAAT